MSTALTVIDPQISFMDLPDSELPVNGATKDMDRLVGFLDKHGDKIDEVRVTLDSHHPVHIAHPVYWRNSKGEHPKNIIEATIAGNFMDAIFTLDKVEGPNAIWSTTNPKWNAEAIEYVRKLPAGYSLVIWPPHCLIGSIGAAVYQPFSEALTRWENNFFANVDWVTKGTNFHTEHYGAVKAEVPRDDDDSTKTNATFAELIERNDVVLFSGEAGSHCLARTVMQIAEEFGDDYLKKIVLLEDTTSPVAGFEGLYEDFKRNAQAKGMRISDTKSFF